MMMILGSILGLSAVAAVALESPGAAFGLGVAACFMIGRA